VRGFGLSAVVVLTDGLFQAYPGCRICPGWGGEGDRAETKPSIRLPLPPPVVAWCPAWPSGCAG
jgi:hypothetical protein